MIENEVTQAQIELENENKAIHKEPVVASHNPYIAKAMIIVFSMAIALVITAVMW